MLYSSCAQENHGQYQLSAQKIPLERREKNENKLSLVSSENISKPWINGGLQIRNMEMQNLALGAKILWKIITRKSSWCKKALWKKYLSRSRLRSLDSPPRVRKGSVIYSILVKAFPFFSNRLTWISGNGKNIKIWEDSIMGEHSLNQTNGLDQIKDHLQSHNLVTL